MKVLVVVPGTAGCGAERQAFMHMSVLRTEGFEVCCMCSEESWLVNQCRRVGIPCEPRRLATGWLDGLALNRFAKAEAVELVLGYGEEGLRIGSKIARSCHTQAFGVVFEAVEPRSLKGINGLFVGSRQLLSVMQEQTDIPVNYLPPAVPDSQHLYSERRASERRRLKLEDHHIAVCVPGPIHPDLGQEVALEALEQLGGHQLRLFLLGNYQHAYGQELRLLAAQHPFAANSMIGQPADAGIYTAFDICLAPFQASHAAQHALPALSFGLPLVATPVGALQDMVTPGSNGYLATSATSQSIAEALLVTLDEGSGISAMSDRSRKIFKEHFTLRQLANTLGSVINEQNVASA